MDKKNKITDKINDNAKFFNIELIEEDEIITLNLKGNDESFSSKVRKIINKNGIIKYEAIENNYLAFDNLLVIITSIKRLQNKINYTDIVFHMMPEKFTLKELQLVFEAILGKKILDPVFRRNIKNKVVKLDEIKSDGGHRPAYLFKYSGENNYE